MKILFVLSLREKEIGTDVIQKTSIPFECSQQPFIELQRLSGMHGRFFKLLPGSEQIQQP